MWWETKKHHPLTERVERRQKAFCNMNGHSIAGSIAHDLNNFLTVILCNVEFILLQTKDDNPVRSELQGIDNAAQIASRLTTQLALVNHMPAREPAQVDLNAVVNDALGMVRRIAGKRIELVTRLDKNMHPVKIVTDQIHRVLLNLAINARDAMPNGGQLIFEIRNLMLDDDAVRKPGSSNEATRNRGERPYVKLSVSDTGFGMDQDVQEHAFEPNFTCKPVGHGTGLGLSLVSEIVRKHGGFISLKSECGNGTTFDIYLPAASNGAWDRL